MARKIRKRRQPGDVGDDSRPVTEPVPVGDYVIAMVR